MLAQKVLKQGPGLPLVFLHGLLGCSADWEPLSALLPSCSCIAFDLPGHGDSPFIPSFEIPLSRFHLIGYSMGGRLALQYASQHPEQIASLTLLSTHPGLKTEEERKERQHSDAAWVKLLFELPIDEFLIRWYHQPLFRSFNPNLEMRRKQNISALAASWLHYSLSKQPYYEKEGILVGEWDEKFRSLCPRPVLIAKAGHVIHLENPQAVAQIIKSRIFS